jgi:uncharacterized protein
VTERAMRDGVDVIHQAKFVDGDWTGIADFLIRVEAPSDLGDFSYEVHDAKLGRTARPTYVFQLLFYTDQVQRIQGERPKRMHLILGDGERPPFAPEEFDAYAREVTRHFLARRGELEAGAEPDYPYPVGECAICPWWKRCADQRRADDHLSLVAGLQRRQGLKFEAAGVRTLPGVVEISRVPGVSGDTLDGLRQQARLQVASRGLDVAVHEFLEPEPGKGFARLPAPSPGDVFFDFEGDPFYGRDGLEYLFGTGFFEGGSWRYWPLWATDEAGERANFEAWMAWITDRLATHPDLHIFHYNHYEPTTLKALMQRYGTCEEQLDELLRRLVMVDLFAVVKQAMRIGTEAYGL